jgi:hypothetical protein
MRVILAALLMLMLAPAWARWVALTESGSTSYYIDPDHITKEGDRRRLFLLEEMKKPGVGGELSRKTQIEFDCKARTSRPRSVSGYTAAMASGQALYTNSRNEKPHAIEADSVEGRVFERACAQ